MHLWQTKPPGTSTPSKEWVGISSGAKLDRTLPDTLGSKQDSFAIISIKENPTGGALMRGIMEGILLFSYT